MLTFNCQLLFWFLHLRSLFLFSLKRNSNYWFCGELVLLSIFAGRFNRFSTLLLEQTQKNNNQAKLLFDLIKINFFVSLCVSVSVLCVNIKRNKNNLIWARLFSIIFLLSHIVVSNLKKSKGEQKETLKLCGYFIHVKEKNIVLLLLLHNPERN